jgi:thiol-disulfide isomerase/thioredoxin
MSLHASIRAKAAAGIVAALAVIAAPQAASLEPGARAPGVDAVPLQPGSARVSLERLRGRVVYVDFWASWCVPCRNSMPALDALARRHGERGFTVVGVNKDASAADAERFLRRVPVGFSLVSDADDAIAGAFGVRAMPSGYLIDRRGVVRRVHRGFTAETAVALEREIAELLEERP